MGHKKSGRRTINPLPMPTPEPNSPITEENLGEVTPVPPTVGQPHGPIAPINVRVGQQKLTRPKFTPRRLIRTR